MALIKSISGIRGTIGGKPGENLTPSDIVKFAAAYGMWLKKNSAKEKLKVVVGRDGRISGRMVKKLVNATLSSIGIDIADCDYSTTPTVEMAVKFANADGGIIITASHNPKDWNALKLLNRHGEFVSGKDGEEILTLAESEEFVFVETDELGKIMEMSSAMEQHLQAVLDHPLVNAEAIKNANFNIVADVVNSTGGIILPMLFRKLGVEKFSLINKENTGIFAHNPEPLPENLTGLSREVVEAKAHLGIAVDPDVDRLCFVCEDGSMFGEEYTLVAVADYVLSHRKGNTVSNMSSTRALRDVTEKHGGTYFPSAVGEVNVVNKMKANDAVIGGEGNGGVIVPELHYGRDALIGIALFLSHLALSGKTVSRLRKTYPDYFISKNKIELKPDTELQPVFEHIKTKYKSNPINEEDGLKIEFDKDWVHLRSSNTEPIIRIYAESSLQKTAENIAARLVTDIREAMAELKEA